MGTSLSNPAPTPAPAPAPPDDDRYSKLEKEIKELKEYQKRLEDELRRRGGGSVAGPSYLLFVFGNLAEGDFILAREAVAAAGRDLKYECITEHTLEEREKDVASSEAIVCRVRLPTGRTGDTVSSNIAHLAEQFGAPLSCRFFD